MSFYRTFSCPASVLNSHLSPPTSNLPVAHRFLPSQPSTLISHLSSMNPAQSPRASPHQVLITGGTGYLGRALIPELGRRGYRVRALVREVSADKIAGGVEVVIGSPLQPADIQTALADIDTLVHLVGVPKPSPSKAREFREIDLA